MKSICLKLSAFTFLSAVICVLAYLFTNIQILFYVSIILAAVAIISLILLLCSRIIVNMRYGINTVFIIVTFLASLASGFLWFLSSEGFDVNDFSAMTLEQLVFIGSVLSCIASIMTLLARCIFVKSQKNTPTYVLKEDTTPVEDVDNG